MIGIQAEIIKEKDLSKFKTYKKHLLFFKKLETEFKKEKSQTKSFCVKI